MIVIFYYLEKEEAASIVPLKPWPGAMHKVIPKLDTVKQKTQSYTLGDFKTLFRERDIRRKNFSNPVELTVLGSKTLEEREEGG